MAFEGDSESAVIANGASLSGAVNLHALRLAGIQMPAAWTAASLTFQASFDGTTYAEVCDTSGAAVTFTVAAGTFVVINPATIAGVRNLKVRSGTSGAPVAQGAERTLRLVVLG